MVFRGLLLRSHKIDSQFLGLLDQHLIARPELPCELWWALEPIGNASPGRAGGCVTRPKCDIAGVRRRFYGIHPAEGVTPGGAWFGKSIQSSARPEVETVLSIALGAARIVALPAPRQSSATIPSAGLPHSISAQQAPTHAHRPRRPGPDRRDCRGYPGSAVRHAPAGGQAHHIKTC